MSTPWHQHASVPLSGLPTAMHRRLVADPTDLVTTATADSLAGLAPLVRSWGLAASTLPTVTARRTDADQIGALELRWQGDEDATAWPSLTARLLVAPDPTTARARLVFLTPRSPRAELATHRLGRVHRERVVDVAVQRFLREVAVGVGRDPVGGPTEGAALARFDRRPVFVHHLEPLDLDPMVLARHLLHRAHGLAGDATAAALEGLAAPLAAGRFRRPPAPSTHVRATSPGTTGVLDLGWVSDEEATGWPHIGLTLAVEAHEEGSRLVVLSHRAPGYDLSRNRMDKHHRDRILREVGRYVAAAALDGATTPEAGRQLDLPQARRTVGAI